MSPTQTSRFIKIGANGEMLPREATEWEAVLDTSTTPALMWTVETKKVSHHSKAEAAAKKMTAAGFSDWNLPTVEQLFPLADRTKVDPAIDGDFFPDCPSDWFWTSTLDAVSPGVLAWFVYFSYGHSFRSLQSGYGFVRGVRVGQ